MWWWCAVCGEWWWLVGASTSLSRTHGACEGAQRQRAPGKQRLPRPGGALGLGAGVNPQVLIARVVVVVGIPIVTCTIKRCACCRCRLVRLTRGGRRAGPEQQHCYRQHRQRCWNIAAPPHALIEFVGGRGRDGRVWSAVDGAGRAPNRVQKARARGMRRPARRSSWRRKERGRRGGRRGEQYTLTEHRISGEKSWKPEGEKNPR